MLYLDNAATTQISDPVLREMMPYLSNLYGNASSTYDLGKMSREAIDQARVYVAELINAEPEEIYFTSGGTEANNWALKGVAPNVNDEILTSKIEHHSVLNTCEWLKEYRNANPRYIDVDSAGMIDLVQLSNYMFFGTTIVSVMAANNEIGTIQPISDIGRICRKKGVIFHTDAVQAFGRIPIDVKAMNIDMLSASGHKIHAPKGVGCLYVRKGIKISPFMHGGLQENGLRAGTENVAAIVGFGEAAYQAKRQIKKNVKKIVTVRDYMANVLADEIPNSFINGDRANRLPNNINITFEGIDSESLVMMLGGLKNPIFISAGAACSSGSMQPSHVLKAIGLTDEQAYGTVRFSLPESFTLDEANYVIESVKSCVEKLRRI